MSTANEQWTAMRLRLRDERMRRNWSLATFARRINRLPITIGSWERGDRHPSARELMNWVAGLGLEVQLVPAGTQGPVDPLQVVDVCERVEDLAHAARLLRWNIERAVDRELDRAAA